MSVAELTRFLSESSANGTFVPSNGRATAEYCPELSREGLLELYRIMVTSRLVDDQELRLLKQGKAWFSISGAGAEAACAAAGTLLRKTDPIAAFYRDRATCLARGVTPYEMFLQLLACAEDPASAGHQMPAHWGHRELAILSGTSPTGSQCLGAQGLAEAIAKTSRILGSGTYPNDSVVYTSIGDAATFQGEFYESVKAAVATRSPVVFHIVDNGWGISVPTYESHSDGDVSAYFRGFPNLTIFKCDGTDVRESLSTFRRAIDHSRLGRGPAMVHSRVVRLYSHSASDDQKKYRLKSDLAVEDERDPLPKFARELVAYGMASPDELLQIVRTAEEEVRRASDKALTRPKTDVTKIESSVYNFDPPRAQAAYRKVVAGRSSQYKGQDLPMAEAINRAMSELMETDPRIVMWGEDIADLHVRYLKNHNEELEGKGGVFGVTRGLQRRHGGHRVWNSPLAEATIVGKAIGFSLQGFLPVVEIQFRDFLNPAWQQLVDEVATMSFRTGGAYQVPMVIRMASGGYLLGAGALHHSEMAAGPLLYNPGLRVAVPSTPRNAAAAIRGAIYCGDPVLFLEPKALYRRRGGFFATPFPDFDMVAFPGEGSEVYGDGEDLTLVAYGNTAALCYDALPRLEQEGIRARLVNLVWLHPIDEDLVREHAEATGRVLIVDEDRRRCGAGSHIADCIYKDRALRREVDVERLAARDSRVSYGLVGEQFCLPQLDDVLRASRELVSAHG